MQWNRSLLGVAAVLCWTFTPTTHASQAGAEALQPDEALQTFHLADGLRIELAVSEPDVVDPVAIAWDEFGRMFVVEMRDYPKGPSEGKPFLSRVKLLEDKDGDGRYETAHVFAEELPFANGVLPWQGGVIVTAAPDIWYLKDSDGDHRADVKEKLFTGFTEGNPQLRVNHPTLGIDNWIYVANGLSGGEVRRADKEDSAKIPIPQMDFRFRPDRSEFEATAGNAQFGLAFDDFGNRFVCSNRNHAVHIVLPDRYLKRNPHLTVSKTNHDIPDHGAAARIFPLTRAMTTAVEHAGSFTAACGLTVYRGSALGESYRGNIFVCDPTGNLVHRDVLVPGGPTFVAKRAPEEARREFLASTDEWFRPVNLANGPDGALWLLDMYRENIEHPQYMPKGLAETLELRKGDDKGRVYRVTSTSTNKPHGSKTWPGKMDSTQLIDLLGHPDSWWRETAQRLLVERQDKAVIEPLRMLARSDKRTLARLHALWVLDGMGTLDDEGILHALGDAAPTVREHAVRFCERYLTREASMREWMLRSGELTSQKRNAPIVATLEAIRKKVPDLPEDPSPRVRFQCALSLGGETPSGGPVDVLVSIVVRDVADEWTQIAVLSSTAENTGKLWERLVSPSRGFTGEPTAAKVQFLFKLGSVIGARRDEIEMPRFLSWMTEGNPKSVTWWQLAALTGMAEGLKPSGKRLNDVLNELPEQQRPIGEYVRGIMQQSSEISRDTSRLTPERTSAVRLMAHSAFDDVAPDLRELLKPQQAQEVQLAATRALGSMNDPGVAQLLLEGWPGHSPPLRRELLDAMFSRRERVVQLLDAIEAGTLKTADLDIQRHQQLLNYSVKEIKERAQKLFENEGTPNRKEVIESYRGILTQAGTIERGREVFKKNCATCHQIQGEGHRVGPELTGLRTRNKEALLMDILDPNRAMEPNYANYLVATREGRVFSGIIASQTATSLTIRRAEGAEDTLLRQDIEQIRAMGQSLMPEALERNVTQAEMVDLIEFLQSVP